MVRAGSQLDASFPTTSWTLVTQGPAALGTLFERYRPAIRTYLFQQRLATKEDVDDLLHGFVLSQMLERDLLGQADPKRGRFRALLVKALHRYIVTQWRYAQRKKRSPDRPVVPLDRVGESEVATCNGVDAFDRAWARRLLDQTLEKMQEVCHEAGRDDVWAVFQARLLGPILQHKPAMSYRRMCQTFRLTSPGQASNLLVTAKRTYIRTLRSLIAEYAVSEEEIDEEIKELARVLADRGA